MAHKPKKPKDLDNDNYATLPPPVYWPEDEKEFSKAIAKYDPIGRAIKEGKPVFNCEYTDKGWKMTQVWPRKT